MELFSAEFFSALLAIIMIDLVLAGDNAIVIGLAARNLPKHQQKKVILWGTVGAIAVRTLATLVVVWLLKIPGLLVIGGVLLLWVAYKLLVEDKGHDVEAGSNFWAAIRTIIIADALMGLDNVLAVAGAAHGSFLLVVLGLIISVPIVVWGSTIILKFVERFPIIITIGAAVLAWTASKMIVKEPFLADYFANPFIKYGFELLMVALVIGIGTYVKSKRKEPQKQAA
jgi:YjbE family integral membrane protein